ncbi:hypothetical protein M5689_025385 [Euphorbia peplus]|nr:hypothetical protein M5689_025385 [Euphorbia peplus]
MPIDPYGLLQMAGLSCTVSPLYINKLIFSNRHCRAHLQARVDARIQFYPTFSICCTFGGS